MFRRTPICSFLIPIATLLTFQSLCFARVEMSAKIGKRWLEHRSQSYVSIDSFVGSVELYHPMNEKLSLFGGPAVVIDHFQSDVDCTSRNCLSANLFKVGIDTGLAWDFSSISFFFQTRWLFFAQGRERSWGRTNLSYFYRGTDVFEEGVEKGESVLQARGVDLVSGLSFPLSERISCSLSLEAAREESRVAKSLKEVENSEGYSMRKSSSLETGWRKFQSSGLYIGIQVRF